MPKPLHQTAKRVNGTFIGSHDNTDYYITDDGSHIWRVRAAPGHKVVSEAGTDLVILTLISWGAHDMANRIRAARMMLT